MHVSIYTDKYKFTHKSTKFKVKFLQKVFLYQKLLYSLN